MKFHESGHGLVAHLLGAVVHEIEVHHGVGGVCRHATLSSATDQLAVLAGGMAGERLLGGEASGASAAHDLADIEMLLPEIRGDPQAALDAAQDRANKLVADNVDKVHALVDALREHGDRLDQQQINQVLGTPGALDRSRLVTAHHESGHAVCALALNRPVHSLRVYADGSGEFRSHPLPEGWTGAVEEEDAIARALFSVPIRHTGTDFRSTDGKLREMCGGMCAQKKFAPSSDWRGNGATDRERARLLAESTNQSHDVVSRRVAYAFAEAERLIDANWPAITKLAPGACRARASRPGRDHADCRALRPCTAGSRHHRLAHAPSSRMTSREEIVLRRHLNRLVAIAFAAAFVAATAAVVLVALATMLRVWPCH